MNAFVRFLITRAGSIATPILAAFVAWAVGKLALFDPVLAANVNQAEVTAFLWGLILAAVNLWTNRESCSEVKRLQNALAVDTGDGVQRYVEVRRAQLATPNDPR